MSVFAGFACWKWAKKLNIENDQEESKNIASQHPEIVERLTAEFHHAVEALKNGESYD